MNRQALGKIAHALVLCLALALIFVPALRGVQGVRWIFVLTFLLVMGYETLHAFRTGHLTASLTKLHRRQPIMNGLHFLAAVCGAVALVLVL